MQEDRSKLWDPPTTTVSYNLKRNFAKCLPHDDLIHAYYVPKQALYILGACKSSFWK